MLYSSYQKWKGGSWGSWMTNGWAEQGYPEQVYELCAAQQADGGAQFWALDMKRNLWSIQHGTPGSQADRWFNWAGPRWNNLPNHVQFKKIAAAWMGPFVGARFWGITENDQLISTYQSVPPGNWNPWQDWPAAPADKSVPNSLPPQWIEVTACDQGDGKGALWALDTKLQLWGMGQESKGGKWGAWVGPNWLKAPKLRNIAAVSMAPPLGCCIWGITEDYKLVYNQQSGPGLNDWWGWRPGSFKDELRGYEITAAGHKDYGARVWVISNSQVLVSQEQNLKSSPPSWEGYWTPELTNS
jgi:hypothetical protein